MARLAAETGGRYTERSNDLTLGYFRAQRDASCVYTLGIYASGDLTGGLEDLIVHVKRDGLRAIHPSRYSFRSPEAKRTSQLRSAWTSPELFGSGITRAYVFPLRPNTSKSWDALLAVRFAVPLDGRPGGVSREFGAVLRTGGTIVHRFDRSVLLTPGARDVDSTPEVTFLEPLTIGPGQYTLTTVVADPDGGRPLGEKVTFSIPEIPRKTAFVVEPILGRRAGRDVVIRARPFADATEDQLEDADGFLPLLVRSVKGDDDLLALSHACWVGGERGPRGRWTATTTMARAVHHDTAGRTVDLESVPIDLTGEGSVRCRDVLDVLPGGSMPGGDYRFEVRLEGAKASNPAPVEFGIESDLRDPSDAGGAALD